MLRQDVITTFGCNIGAAAFGLLSSVTIARALGPEQQGLLALALFFPSLLSSFLGLGQETVNASFAGLHKDRRNALMLQSFVLALGGGCIGTLIILGYFRWLPIEKGQFSRVETQMVWMTCLIVPANILFQMLNALLRGVERIRAAAGIQLLNGSVLGVLSLGLMFLPSANAQSALWVFVICPVLGCAIALVGLRHYRMVGVSDWCSSFFKRSLSFGALISLTAFGSFLLYRVNLLILGYWVSNEEVACYFVATGISERILMLPQSVSTAFLPRLANDLAGRQHEVPQAFRCNLVITLIAMFVMGALGIPGILLLYGSAYAHSIIPFLILLPGIAACGGSSVLSSYLIAKQKVSYGISVAFTALSVNIVLSLSLTPFVGIVGASAANSIAFMVAAGQWIMYYHRESGTPLRKMIPRASDLRLVTSASWTIISRGLQWRT